MLLLVQSICAEALRQFRGFDDDADVVHDGLVVELERVLAKVQIELVARLNANQPPAA